MSRGIVVGVKWHVWGAGGVSHGDWEERVCAVPDAKIKAGLDRIVRVVPELIRKDVAMFFAPLLENNVPHRDGTYPSKCGDEYNVDYIVWWKRAFVDEGEP